MNFEEITNWNISFEKEDEFNKFIAIMNAAFREDLNTLKLLKRDILEILDILEGT